MKLQEAINYYNENRGDGPKMDRITLGRILFPGHSDGAINSALSRWSKEKYIPNPEFNQYIKIAQLTGVSLDFLFGQTINPKKQ